MILIYLPLLYPVILFGKKVYLKCTKLQCCQKQGENEEEDTEPLLVHPSKGLGNFVRITELRARVPTSSDEESETDTQSEDVLLENQNTDAVAIDLQPFDCKIYIFTCYTCSINRTSLVLEWYYLWTHVFIFLLHVIEETACICMHAFLSVECELTH